MAPPALRIHERLWSSAHPLRQREWSTLIADLLRDEPPFSRRGAAEIVIDFDEAAVVVVFEGAVDEGAVRVPRDRFADLLAEYLAVIERLCEDDLPVAKVEALDMAKKVVHDEGAKRLGTIVPDLSDSHETRRRFFSLVVALLVDTTGKPAAHRHL